MYAERLKALREENNLTQKTLAELLGITRSLYGRYETEHETIPIKYLNILANYFNVSLDYILNINDTKKYIKNNLNIDKKLSGNRLKEFRKNNKITQLKLAEILNVSQSTIAEYERGTNIIATPFLYTICKKYNISADYLLGRTD